MKELKGTKTEKNLQEAFAGESQARNKYTYFASKAKKDGFVQIANIFEETAANEKERVYQFRHLSKYIAINYLTKIKLDVVSKKNERKTGLGPATPTLARLCSTN